MQLIATGFAAERMFATISLLTIAAARAFPRGITRVNHHKGKAGFFSLVLQEGLQLVKRPAVDQLSQGFAAFDLTLSRIPLDP